MKIKPLSRSICLCLLSVSSPLWAQQQAAADAAAAGSDGEVKELSSVSVTGLRGLTKSVTDSAVPVDVISQQEIESVPSTDTLDALKTLVPSFSVSRATNSTTGSFIRAISLRGLSADKTLLLVNGKRRHKSGSVAMSGSGSQAADAAVIPAIALKSMEVLRDGAAAQYGSDAIAGVINFQLKDDDHGGSFAAQTGQYYEGDGEDYLVAGNIGMPFPFANSGFVNFSAELTKNARVVRSRQYSSPAFDPYEEAASNPAYAAAVDLSKPLYRAGKPKSEAYRFFVNSGVDVGDYGQFYSFMNYSWSEGWTDANYRYPGHGQAVTDTPVRLQDGSAWTFSDIFPAGFTPQFAGRVKDASATFGYRDVIPDGEKEFTYDLSGRYGRNQIDYYMSNTVNPSLGADSPRKFHSYGFLNEEMALNADASYVLPVGWMADRLTLNAGAELRRENFEILPGDPGSYAQGSWAFADPFGFCDGDALAPGAPAGQGIDCANPGDPVYNVLSVGASGFPGFSPEHVGRYHNTSHALYLEASGNVTDKWFLDAAGRYEHYDDFGGNSSFKLATRYAVNDWLALRASVGSGFRAPSAGIVNIQSVSIVSIDGVMQETGLFPAASPVAGFLGAKALKPEESVNASLGVVLTPADNLDITLDGYRIKIDDMVYATSLITVTDAIRQQMVDAGVPGADTISSVRFFQNAFDATVSGVDLVGSYRKDWGNGQATDFTVGINYNKYEVDKIKIAGLFTDADMFNFEKSAPKFKGNVTARHDFNNALSGMLRANIYGPYKYMRTTAPYPVQSYHSEVMLDAELQYKLTDKVRLTVGASNLLDNYPQKDSIDSLSYGQVYRDGVVDWLGGFYYARLNLNF